MQAQEDALYLAIQAQSDDWTEQALEDQTKSELGDLEAVAVAVVAFAKAQHNAMRGTHFCPPGKPRAPATVAELIDVAMDTTEFTREQHAVVMAYVGHALEQAA